MSTDLRQPWAECAEDLVVWAWARLVNRADVWGGYHDLTDRKKVITRSDGTSAPLGQSTTRPAVAKRGKVFLSPAMLEEHFRATDPRHIVGLHSTSEANACRWGAVDVDRHGETSTPAEINLAAALSWYDRLRRLGFRPLLTDSNGKGGYHLLVIFAAAVPTPTVFAFLQCVVANYARLGMTRPPETFPKQTHVEPGHFGNWLRLPGRHHTREHWSRVWDGARWLEGPAAAAFILTLPGDNPALVPAMPAPRPPRQAYRRSAFRMRTDTGQLAGAIRAYIAKLPSGLGEGQRRDDFAFNFAAWLSRDLALPDAEALAWLGEWDQRQAAPKGEARLREILGNAQKYGQRAVGCGRRPPIQQGVR